MGSNWWRLIRRKGKDRVPGIDPEYWFAANSKDKAKAVADFKRDDAEVAELFAPFTMMAEDPK